MVNRPTRTVEFTDEELEFLMGNCDANLKECIKLVQGARQVPKAFQDQAVIANLIKIGNQFRAIHERLMKAR